MYWIFLPDARAALPAAYVWTTTLPVPGLLTVVMYALYLAGDVDFAAIIARAIMLTES